MSDLKRKRGKREKPKIQPHSPCRGLLLLFISVVPLWGSDKAVFWQYEKDRYGKMALSNFMEVDSRQEPMAALARRFGYKDWVIRRKGDVFILSEKPVEGVVPILVLHKISREEKYGLTARRFMELLRYIRRNNWYMVSDYQYLKGDFSRVPTGKKPIVLGADDASYGNLTYKTYGDPLKGEVYRILGRPVIEPNSMVGILERYAKREDGRINFTFYISFDAIPFRQLDAAQNPGFPYRNILIVGEKMRYLNNNFILGIHSLQHVYAYDMGPDKFAEDVLQAWALIEEYLDGSASTVRTMSYPYGIGKLSDRMRDRIQSLRQHDRKIEGAFDFNNKMAPPPGVLRDNFAIPRINADNRHWPGLLSKLDSSHAVVARRIFIWQTNVKKIPRMLQFRNAEPSDSLWIMVLPKK